MSKRKPKAKPNKYFNPLVGINYPDFPPFRPETHTQAVLDLRGKVSHTDGYVDVKIIIPNRNGTLVQHTNRFYR